MPAFYATIIDPSGKEVAHYHLYDYNATQAFIHALQLWWGGDDRDLDNGYTITIKRV